LAQDIGLKQEFDTVMAKLEEEKNRYETLDKKREELEQELALAKEGFSDKLNTVANQMASEYQAQISLKEEEISRLKAEKDSLGNHNNTITITIF